VKNTNIIVEDFVTL